MSEFKTTEISSKEQLIIDQHLSFIKHVTNEAVRYGCRAIIGGGYAVDGVIGKITRPHDDIDIQLYGLDVLNPVLLSERFLTGPYSHYSIEDKGRNEYWHSFFIKDIGAEIYYIRVAYNPFSESKIVIKSDNTYTDEHDYETKMVVFNGVRYEVQNPVQELADKIYKRDHRGDPKLPKHDQDIYNLRLITDPYDVDFAIRQKIKYSSR